LTDETRSQHVVLIFHQLSLLGADALQWEIETAVLDLLAAAPFRAIVIAADIINNLLLEARPEQVCAVGTHHVVGLVRFLGDFEHTFPSSDRVCIRKFWYCPEHFADVDERGAGGSH
jgi:hypothetical protein